VNVRLLVLTIPALLLGIGARGFSQVPGAAGGRAADSTVADSGAVVPKQTDGSMARPAALVTPANGRSIKLEGLIQYQAASSSVDTVVELDSELRRMRLQVDGDAGNGFGGRLQMDFDSNRARVRDAYAEYKPTSSVILRGGQFKPPFNVIETTSAKRLPVIERGGRIRGVRQTTTSNFLVDNRYAGRQRGVMATAKLPGGRFTVQGGGWFGTGEASEDNDGKMFGGRVEFSALPLPEKTSKPLLLGVAAVTNGFFGSPRDTSKVVDGDTLIVEDPEYGTAFEGSVEYGAYGLSGLHVIANVVTGDNPAALSASGADVELETFRGLQGWIELLLPVSGTILTGVAPAFRADHFDPDTDADDDATLLLTPGLNLYFGSNAKLQVNYDVLDPEASDVDGESAFRLQTQLLF
jgi:hypothetical protein